MFASTLFVRIRTNSRCIRVRQSCLSGRIARVCWYDIRANADELAVFAGRLFVRMQTNSPYLPDRYSCVCGRVARVRVYSIRVHTDE